MLLGRYEDLRVAISNLVLMPIMALCTIHRPMNDDVDLLLCIHAKVYLQVTTCADRSQCGTLSLSLGRLRASLKSHCAPWLCKGIGSGIVSLDNS